MVRQMTLLLLNTKTFATACYSYIICFKLYAHFLDQVLLLRLINHDLKHLLQKVGTKFPTLFTGYDANFE